MRIIIHMFLIYCFSPWLWAGPQLICQQEFNGGMESVSWPGIPGETLIPENNQICVFMQPGEVDVHITPNGGHVQFTNNEAPYYVKQPVILSGESTILQLGTQNWYTVDHWGKRQPIVLFAPEVHFNNTVDIDEGGRVHIHESTGAGHFHKKVMVGRKASLIVEDGGVFQVDHQAHFAGGSCAEIRNDGHLACTEKCQLSLSGFVPDIIDGAARIEVKDATFVMKGNMTLEDQAVVRFVEMSKVSLLGPVTVKNRYNRNPPTLLQLGHKNFLHTTPELVIGNQLTLEDGGLFWTQGGKLTFTEGAEIILPITHLHWQPRIGIFFGTQVTMDNLALTVDPQIYWPIGYELLIIGAGNDVSVGTLNINSGGYALELEAVFHVSPHDNSKLVTLVRKGMPGGYAALTVSDKAREVAKRVDALIQDSENKGLTPTEQRFLLHLDTRPDQESFDEMLAESALILDSFIEERLFGKQLPEFLSWPDVMEIIKKIDSFFMKGTKMTIRRKVLKHYQIQKLQNKLQKELENNASEFVAYAGAGIVIFSMWLRHQLR